MVAAEKKLVWAGLDLAWGLFDFSKLEPLAEKFLVFCSLAADQAQFAFEDQFETLYLTFSPQISFAPLARQVDFQTVNHPVTF